MYFFRSCFIRNFQRHFFCRFFSFLLVNCFLLSLLQLHLYSSDILFIISFCTIILFDAITCLTFHFNDFSRTFFIRSAFRSSCLFLLLLVFFNLLDLCSFWHFFLSLWESYKSLWVVEVVLLYVYISRSFKIIYCVWNKNRI